MCEASAVWLSGPLRLGSLRRSVVVADPARHAVQKVARSTPSFYGLTSASRPYARRPAHPPRARRHHQLRGPRRSSARPPPGRERGATVNWVQPAGSSNAWWSGSPRARWVSNSSPALYPSRRCARTTRSTRRQAGRASPRSRTQRSRHAPQMGIRPQSLACRTQRSRRGGPGHRAAELTSPSTARGSRGCAPGHRVFGNLPYRGAHGPTTERVGGDQRQPIAMPSPGPSGAVAARRSGPVRGRTRRPGWRGVAGRFASRRRGGCAGPGSVDRDGAARPGCRRAPG